MNRRNKNISYGYRIRHFIFRKCRPGRNFLGVRFVGTDRGFPHIYFQTAIPGFPIPIPALTTSYEFSKSSQPENENLIPARRKPLIVRVVRKALRAGFFLTTLTLHPKNMLLSKTVFWFSAGGRWNGNGRVYVG